MATNYENQYFTIRVREDRTQFMFTCSTARTHGDVSKTIEVSTDEGSTWTKYTAKYEYHNGQATITPCVFTLDRNQTMMIRGTGDYSLCCNYFFYLTEYRYSVIATDDNGEIVFDENGKEVLLSRSGSLDIEGNVMSLVNGDNYLNGTLKGNDLRAFFRGLNVVNANNLVLPINVKDGCFAYMFSECGKITAPPTLPATTLASDCYYKMFAGSSIVTAPELPATSLARGCYYGMFTGCGNLVNPPSILPATSDAEDCYNRMFSGCIELERKPEIRLTKANYYRVGNRWTCSNEHMFYGCEKLPETD